MIWCRWVQKRLVIPEDETTWPAWARRHVAQCRGCATFRDRSIQLRATFATKREEGPDEAAVQRIMAVVREWEYAGSLPERSVSNWPAWGVRLAVVGVFAALVVISYLDLPQLTPMREPVDDVTALRGPVPRPHAVSPQPSTFSSASYSFIERASLPSNWSAVPEGSWVSRSNVGRSVDFGGAPVMPVSFDY